MVCKRAVLKSCYSFSPFCFVFVCFFFNKEVKNLMHMFDSVWENSKVLATPTPGIGLTSSASCSVFFMQLNTLAQVLIVN